MKRLSFAGAISDRKDASGGREKQPTRLAPLTEVRRQRIQNRVENDGNRSFHEKTVKNTFLAPIRLLSKNNGNYVFLIATSRFLSETKR